METIAAKIQLMESTITDMAGRIDVYVTKMDGMMVTIENNDINVKGTFETRMGELLATTNQTIADTAGISNAQLQALRQEVGSNLVGIDGRLQSASDQIAGAETAYIGMEQIQEDHKNHIAAMEQEVLRIATETSDFRKFEKQVVSEVTKLKMEIEQGSVVGNGTSVHIKKDSYKPKQNTNR